MKSVLRSCRLAILLGGLVLAVGACSDHGTAPVDPGGAGGGTAVSFAADLQPVFTATCTGCHGPGGEGGLNLSAGVAHGNLVGVAAVGHAGQRVVAGDPDQSVLYLKISGAAAVGDRMPLGGALDAGTIEKVRQWIAAGALDN